MYRLAAAIIVALVLGCTVSHRALSQTANDRKNSDASVSGRITIQGKPAPGIIVGLRPNEPAQSDAPFKGATDQDGKYRITNVPAGTYQVMPATPAFVVSDSNKSSIQSLVIGEGDNITGIDFDLVKGGVITGKVTDAEGRPIAEEHVFLVAADYPRGGNARVPNNFQTDDRGIYRMFGVPPGRYKVSIGEESIGPLSSSRSRRSFPITFYPDAAEAAKAAVVEVGEGTEASNIDITIPEAPRTFSVNGRAIDRETGKPVTGVAISLTKTMIIDAHSSSGYGGVTDVRTNSEGEFTLEKLPAGKYSVSVQPPPDSSLRTESVAFDIVDQDVSGLVIKTTTGASISGVVVLERTRDGNNAGPAPAWLQVYWQSEAQGHSYSSNSSTQIKADGTFYVGGLTTGTVGFSVGAWSQFGDAKPIPVLRVERDGVAQPNGIQIQNGEHLTGIRVVAAYASGSIRGVVKLDNGTLPSNGHLVVSISKVGENAPNGGGNETDARGRFVIEGLATGTYEVTVTAYVPEWRQGPRRTKQMVTVTDGVATDVILTLDLSPPKIP